MGIYYSDKYDLFIAFLYFSRIMSIFGFYKIYDLKNPFSKKQKECRSQIKKWFVFIKDLKNNFDFIILIKMEKIFNHSKYQNLQHRKMR